MEFEIESARTQGWLRLGLEYLRGGRFEESGEALAEAEDTLPALLGVDLRITDKNVRLTPMIHSQLYLAIGEFTKGGKAARRSLRLVPDWADQEFEAKSIHGEKADYSAYLRGLDEYSRKNPKDLDARFLLGYQHYFSSKPKRARAALESILKANPVTARTIPSKRA